VSTGRKGARGKRKEAGSSNPFPLSPDPNLPFDPTEVARRLLAWYGREGRDLPWRQTRDPYRIWVSEIMLQQTTVAAVIPYYERFLQRFPTVERLASASLDDVIAAWAGLGYYSRARNLHRTACEVVATSNGKFPKTLEKLVALPGIGRSTAGAILAIAFDQPAPILDGNVRRVLVRLFAWRDDPRSSKAEKQLWQWAEQLTPDDAAHDYAQAIMDLGAMLCVPRQPLCESCPINELCRAYAQGMAEDLPVKQKKGALAVRRQVAVVVVSGQNLLLKQRPVEGFLGGLWEFPTADCPKDLDAEDVASGLLQDLQLKGKLTGLVDISHVYSHFKLDLAVFIARADPTPVVAEKTQGQWVPGEDVASFALHGAHKKILPALKLAGQ
jgi:A/G-specific adenine glycosylase